MTNPSVTMQTPVQIAVTGAAGQISYSLLFRLIAGDLLGPDQPVVLRLLEIPEALGSVDGLIMELLDCASPLLKGVVSGSDPETVFENAEFVFLVGAQPRGPGMERKDLLQRNAEIFSVQGRALNATASRNAKILVVGNPANTNALIAKSNAPDLPAENFTAMTRLDHNRAVSLLAARCGTAISDVRRVIIWGNHSNTQYPDLHHATVQELAALERVERDWYERDYIAAVQNRGAEVIKARGKSSAASAANAALDHMRTWIRGTPAGDWTSMAVCSDGSYGIEPGLISSFPVQTSGGTWRIVPDLSIDAFSRGRIDASVAELVEERETISHLIG